MHMCVWVAGVCGCVGVCGVGVGVGVGMWMCARVFVFARYICSIRACVHVRERKYITI